MAQPISSTGIPESGVTLKILVVDPQPQSRSFLKGSLLSLDMVEAVIERGSAVDLQQVVAEDSVQLVILDQNLGDADGHLNIIRSLQHNASAHKPRYILVGQQLDDETRRKASELGVTGFLTKPFDLQTLERVLCDGLGWKAPVLGKAAGGASVFAKGGGPQIPKDVLERLKRVTVFTEFTDVELLRLLKICQIRRFSPGEYIFRQGDDGDRLYVLISGQVDIAHLRGDQARLLDKIHPGECFGEMAIIDSGPRSADAFATSEVMVIEVTEETVNRDNDVIALKLVRQLARLMAHRIRELVAKY